MKKTTITICLLLIATLAFSQEDREMKTLFGNGGIYSHGGYGGITTSYSSIDNRDAILIGGRGAWLINHRIGIGLAGTGFLTEARTDTQLNNRYEYIGGYGGLFLEFIVNPESPVHLSFPITIGAGGIAYSRAHNSFRGGDFDFFEEDSQAFFVVEPGIELELNVIKFMRVAFGVSYRHTSDIELNYASSGQAIAPKDALRGLSGGVTLKFGKF
ncbi:hypothetical protein BFP97_15095 [Roseivirga sp. 4D4]|uniref:hypothetical protein n=1 Tax=Roseivirga sp. 4D4 TaxID=1889784 RepID=UPI000853DBE2|nr:hypothetical protein [Roseivirga sp. 4D4]OEK02771.1 hypothetical protein BFP97_15095 [Roseivirga sp. 4D4]